MSEEILNEEIMEEIPVEETVIERKNPLTVISKNTFGEYNIHDIQQNSSWGKNPYEDYALVPDDMVEAIMETRGFVDIVLNEEGTEIVSFTALEIPEIPEPEPEPSLEERVTAVEETTESNTTEVGLLQEYCADLLYKQCLFELGMSEDEV